MEVVVEGYVTLLGRGSKEVLREGEGEGEGEGERYHGDGHDGWVGDVDSADHVRTIGSGVSSMVKFVTAKPLSLFKPRSRCQQAISGHEITRNAYLALWPSCGNPPLWMGISSRGEQSVHEHPL